MHQSVLPPPSLTSSLSSSSLSSSLLTSLLFTYTSGSYYPSYYWPGFSIKAVCVRLSERESEKSILDRVVCLRACRIMSSISLTSTLHPDLNPDPLRPFPVWEQPKWKKVNSVKSRLICWSIWFGLFGHFVKLSKSVWIYLDMENFRCRRWTTIPAHGKSNTDETGCSSSST